MNHIAGYYTLSAADVALKDMPDDVARRLPRYPVVLVARIGRLAIDRDFQGKRLGAAMLWDAANRSLRAEMGVFALAVDAKDEQAASFYRHHGFVRLPSQPLKLFLPLSTIARAGSSWDAFLPDPAG
jgi:GNAT superfamily N-acetyltransferase